MTNSNLTNDFVLEALNAPQSFGDFKRTWHQSTANIWNGNHPQSPLYTKLYEQLVPDNGQCDTVEGELLRAASKIGYDGCNNGHCNNQSGAFNFIVQHFKHWDDATALKILEEVVNCSMVSSAVDQCAADFMAIEICRAINLDNLHPNKVDMLDLTDPDDYHHEEEDDEWEDDWNDDYEEDCR